MLNIPMEPSSMMKVTQGMGFFGMSGSKIEMASDFPPIETPGISFDPNLELPWPLTGITHIERILLTLTSGKVPFTMQTLGLMMEDIAPDMELSLGHREINRRRFIIELKTLLHEVLPLVRLDTVSGAYNGFKIVHRNVNVFSFSNFISIRCIWYWNVSTNILIINLIVSENIQNILNI